MFSGLRAERRRPRSLRAKLTAQLVAVVAAVCLIFTLVTELALHSVLVGQLDKQLLAAGKRAGPPRAANQPGGPGNGPPPNPLDGPNQSPGTLAALMRDNGWTPFAERSTVTDTREYVSIEGQRQLAEVPIDGAVHTLDIDGFGEYRMIADRTPPGDKLIIGLPLLPVDDAMLTVGLILGGVSLIALVAAFGAGTVIVRRTLRPLRRVAATASRVAELPLDRGEVALSERV